MSHLYDIVSMCTCIKDYVSGNKITVFFTVLPFVAILLTWVNNYLKNKQIKYWFLLIIYNTMWVFYGYYIKDVPISIDGLVSAVIGLYGLYRFIQDRHNN